MLEPGWTALYARKDNDKKDDEQDLPEFRPGDSGPHESFVWRGETTPPKSFTESTPLGAMPGGFNPKTDLGAAAWAQGAGAPLSDRRI